MDLFIYDDQMLVLVDEFYMVKPSKNPYSAISRGLTFLDRINISTSCRKKTFAEIKKNLQLSRIIQISIKKLLPF